MKAETNLPLSLLNALFRPLLLSISQPSPHTKFKSSHLTSPYEKPWLTNRDPRMKYDCIFFLVFGLIGCGIGAYLV